MIITENHFLLYGGEISAETWQTLLSIVGFEDELLHSGCTGWAYFKVLYTTLLIHAYIAFGWLKRQQKAIK